MSTAILSNQYWAYGKLPDIRFDFKYDTRRIGSDCQYKFYFVFHSLNTPQSGFGYPIYASIMLDGVTKLNGIMLKNTSPMKWFDSVTVKYESEWVTVANKLTGTTSYRMTMFSGMGMDRTQTWNGSIAIADITSTADASDFILGNSVPITINRAYDSYTSTVSLTVGTHTVSNDNVGSSTSFNTSAAWSDAFPSAEAGDATITVTTYDGNGNQVGNPKSLTVSASVPSSVLPTASVTVEPVYGFNGQYLINRSKAKITVSASGAYGSSVSACEIICGLDTSSSYSYTSRYLSEAGSVAWSATIKDSRGRTNAYSGTINVLNYTEPTITAKQPFRCLSNGTFSESGTYAFCEAEASYDTSIEGNSLTINASYKALPDGYFVDGGTLESGVGLAMFTGNILLNGNYTIKITATDAVGKSATFEGKITSSNNYLLTAVKGKFAFGKYVDQSLSDGLQVQGDLHVSGAADFGSAIPIASGGTGATTAAEAKANLGIGSCELLLDTTLGNNSSTTFSANGHGILIVISQISSYDNNTNGRNTQIIPVEYLTEKRYFYHEVTGHSPYPFSLSISDSTITMKREGNGQAHYIVYGM